MICPRALVHIMCVMYRCMPGLGICRWNLVGEPCLGLPDLVVLATCVWCSELSPLMSDEWERVCNLCALGRPSWGPILNTSGPQIGLMTAPYVLQAHASLTQITSQLCAWCGLLRRSEGGYSGPFHHDRTQDSCKVIVPKGNLARCWGSFRNRSR